VPSTVVSYVRALRDLQKHFDRPADDLGREELLAYLAFKRKTYSSSSLNMQVCALKYYYREVLRRQNLVVSIPNPRHSKQIGEVLTTTEMRHFISSARSLRHRLVIELLFGLGLRASEVGRLRLGDFNARERTVTIRTSKGGITRVLPYGERLRMTLNQYFKHERPKDYLIPGRDRSDGPGISVRGVQYIVRMTLDRSRLRKHVCPHALRHSFAVHYLNNGGNILRLQQLLGHTYLTSTLIYLKYASIRLRDIASPLAFLYDVPDN
jgi:site-specific recombinase XerD